MASLVERGLWVVIVLYTSYKPVIRLFILGEKGQLKILRGCIVKKKIRSGGVGELRLSLSLSLAQPTPLAKEPSKEPGPSLPSYPPIYTLFVKNYCQNACTQMHNHYIQLFQSYVLETPLRYKALAKTLIIKYRYMLIKNKRCQ